MTVHPDDVAAVVGVIYSAPNGHVDALAGLIIATLDTARTKRMPKDVTAIIHSLRWTPPIQRLEQAADLLEAQAIRIADLTKSLADAMAQVEKAPAYTKEEMALARALEDELPSG